VGLRETINQKPGLVTRVTVGVMGVALAVIVYQQWSNRPAKRAPGERPMYVPATQDRPEDALPEPRKGAPARTPGRAAIPRLRKIFAAAAERAAIPSPVNTPESIA
jgi:hypothetical protein